MSRDQPSTPKPGPKPETLKLEGDVDWKDALRHAMSKPKADKVREGQDDRKDVDKTPKQPDK